MKKLMLAAVLVLGAGVATSKADVSVGISVGHGERSRGHHQPVVVRSHENQHHEVQRYENRHYVAQNPGHEYGHSGGIRVTLPAPHVVIAPPRIVIAAPAPRYDSHDAYHHAEADHHEAVHHEMEHRHERAHSGW